MRYFRKIDGRWYLRNEAVGADGGEGRLIEHVEVSDELSAIAWLRQQLARQPMMIGAIKPLWFKATAKLTGDLSTQLERLLRQNFWYDRATNYCSDDCASTWIRSTHNLPISSIRTSNGPRSSWGRDLSIAYRAAEE